MVATYRLGVESMTSQLLSKIPTPAWDMPFQLLFQELKMWNFLKTISSLIFSLESKNISQSLRRTALSFLMKQTFRQTIRHIIHLTSLFAHIKQPPSSVNHFDIRSKWFSSVFHYCLLIAHVYADNVGYRLPSHLKIKHSGILLELRECYLYHCCCAPCGEIKEQLRNWLKLCLAFTHSLTPPLPYRITRGLMVSAFHLNWNFIDSAI